MLFQRLNKKSLLGTVAAVLLPALLVAGCKKNDSESGPSGGDVPEPAPCTYDVYTCATFDTLLPSGKYSKSCAGVFCNNQFTRLQTQQEDKHVMAYGVSVDGNDVYVCGSEDLKDAVYWKNGQVVYLPEGSCALGMVAKNGNTYICGYEAKGYTAVACCWINNTKYELKDGNFATAITVDNQGHLYIVGYSQDPNTFKKTLLYWTNSETSNISRYTISSSRSCEPKAVCVDETHLTPTTKHPIVCIGGTEAYDIGGSQNKVWVERKGTEITSPSSGNEVFGISSCNGKLYTCGNDRNYAKYWVSDLTTKGDCPNLRSVNLSDGAEPWFATGVHAINGKAFVVGYREPTNDHIPTVWVDGEVFLNLTSPYRLKPTGIYVVARPIAAPVAPEAQTGMPAETAE